MTRAITDLHLKTQSREFTLSKIYQNGNPTEDNLGVAMIRRIWDPVHRIETESYHDLAGNLVEVLYGFCEVHYYLDEELQLQSAYCYNRHGEIVEEPVTAGASCSVRGK